jgi:RNA recognition motif-containing protein
MKILVRNLSRKTTEEQLRELFSGYGLVQSCNVVLDAKSGQSKGFAFVNMPRPGEAKAAIKSLNDTLLDESRIRVKRAEERSAGMGR